MKKQSRARQAGFTLIEVMVVLVIIAIMGTFVAVEVMDKPEQAQQIKIKSDINSFGAALDFYKLENYRYPTTDEGLAILVPKHIKKMNQDPWKRDYLYVSPGRDGSDYEIYTLGRDGLEGGEGIDADISSATGSDITVQ
jgi:general secretion pathway protein G